MHNIVSKLLIYGNMPEDSILMELSNIIREYKGENYKKDEIITRIYHQIKRILEISTDYAFDKNLWHNYLTYLLITNENPFSLTCEKVGASDGSVNYFAKNDFKQFKKLFDYDFGPMEEELGIDCFSRIENYKAIGKPELMYNKNVSEKVRALSEKLENTKNEDEFFTCVTDFYKDYGVGMFGLNKAFRISDNDGKLQFHAINNMEQVALDDLVGYEIQKKKLVDNTEAFVQGRKANNCLLFGDSGTGKSPVTLKIQIHRLRICSIWIICPQRLIKRKLLVLFYRRQHLFRLRALTAVIYLLKPCGRYRYDIFIIAA